MRMILREFQLMMSESVKKMFRPVGFEYGKTGKSYTANGNRECARRRKQIANGTLQVSR